MVPATYRATIVTIDSQTVVVLSGNIRNNSGALMAQAMTGLKPDAPEFPLHSDESVSAADVRRLPNTRLKLSAPVICGRIPFVNVLVRRRSLSALR